MAKRFKECKFAGCASRDFSILDTWKATLPNGKPYPDGRVMYLVVCSNGHETEMDSVVDMEPVDDSGQG